ncbi:acyltransferase family protein [Bradyrhizobium centrosematis]|uniref:acyltransferase family protein n=1 Tax=Bradyrhizobium centrosematis TaxID=1300039 RepID=UPI002169DE41|nr:acyltransferase family protein [Bradyrhizobium centrosematis]MCS3765308.1 peptidoglycan/LPS O-acetylase OafA/YrhL [Bradyrhizobium centrosematis]MCS3773992.1 peptidoglycan/LPS O-acetylase OafA/YrhL [Bradyrhizobium centrosematis]
MLRETAQRERDNTPVLGDGGKGYRPEIDGLRAIAVFSVILFHAHLRPFGLEPFVGGYLGVDIFFVISGYLIAGIISSDLRRHSFSLTQFYERRARRILPALLLVITMSFVLGLATMTPQPFAEFTRSILAVIFFVANIYFYFREDYFAEPSELTPLLHTWSLSLEEQFYFLFPLLAMASWKYARNALAPFLLIAMAASFLLALYFNQSDPSAAFYFFHTRAWELLAGCIVAQLADRKTPAWMSRVNVALPALGLCLIAVSVCLPGAREGSVGLNAALAVCGAVLIIWFGRGSDPASRLLGTRPIVALGLISYSLYLWHQPVLAFTRAYLVTAPDNMIVLGEIVACVLLSYLSWRFVELPYRRRNIVSRGLLATSLLASFAALLVAVGYSELTGGIPQRFPTDQLTLLALKPERATAIIDGRSCRRQAIEDACIIGNVQTEPTFAVLGDSHAEALTGPLGDMLKQMKLAAYVYTYPGCPFILGVETVDKRAPCTEFESHVEMALRERHIKSVIINDRSNAYILGSGFDNGEGGVELSPLVGVQPIGFSGTGTERVDRSAIALRESLLRLLQMGITIYYVLPVPEVGWHVPKTLVKLVAQNRLPLTTSLSKYHERNRMILNIVRELRDQKGFVPIFPERVFCSGMTQRCYTHEGTSIFYTDTDHLSREGAEKLVGAINEEVQRRLSTP